MVNPLAIGALTRVFGLPDQDRESLLALSGAAMLLTERRRSTCSMPSMDAATDRQRTIQRYVTDYSAGDYESAVEIFTDDVRWEVVGAFEITGRDAYLANMANESVTGHPDIRVTRFFEAGDSVVAEGTVRQQLASGEWMDVRFLDVFDFRADLVCEKRSYCVTSGQFAVAVADA